MAEMSVEEEYYNQSQGVEDTNTENQEDEPLFLTKDDIPEYPGGQMSHADSSYTAPVTLQGVVVTRVIAGAGLTRCCTVSLPLSPSNTE